MPKCKENNLLLLLLFGYKLLNYYLLFVNFSIITKQIFCLFESYFKLMKFYSKCKQESFFNVMHLMFRDV